MIWQNNRTPGFERVLKQDTNKNENLFLFSPVLPATVRSGIY